MGKNRKFNLLVLIPNSGMSKEILADRKQMLSKYASNNTEITVECIYMYSACLIGRTHPDRPKEILYSITEIGEETLTL